MIVFSRATSRSSTSNNSRQVCSPCASVSSATVGVRSLFREGGEEGVCFAEQEDYVGHR
jgi:hypothetical protein